MIDYYPKSYQEIALIDGYSVPNGGFVSFLLDQSFIDVSGDGFLSGTHPNGIVTDGGVPSESDIIISIRSLHFDVIDGLVVARAKSKQDGTWLVEGLSKFIPFNVVARKAMRNDAIVSDVIPK